MRPEVTRARSLVRVEREAREISTLYFSDELCSMASPGQYVMVWTPKVDEVPMTLSTIVRNDISSITVRSVGEATKALCRLRTGDRIGVRGPFGNGFTVVGDSPLLVAGGVGSASMAPLAEAILSKGVKPIFVLGARSRDRLLFKGRLESLLGNNLMIATDDGSCGFNGLASDCALRLIERNSFDILYMCGPELMMGSLFSQVEKKGIPVQASLERYIKCAIGLCGSCAIGHYRVCKDGPVFKSEELRTVCEKFGRKRMDPSGRLLDVDH